MAAVVMSSQGNAAIFSHAVNLLCVDDDSEDEEDCAEMQASRERAIQFTQSDHYLEVRRLYYV